MSIPAQDFRQPAPWKSVALYVGFALYSVGFFLPAVDQWKGWDCAWLALEYWHADKVSPLVLFGGLINPLGVVYLLLALLNVASKICAVLATAMLVCIPLTWFALDRMDAKVHVGHYFWIAGILLMLSPVIGDIPRLPAAKWLGVVGLIVITWLGIPRAISLTMHPATARDDFFYVVAWNFREPAICQKIDPSAIGRDDQREDHELTYMRSDCYRNIAAMLNAPALCENVRSAGMDRLWGSQVTKWNCRRQHYTWGTAWPADGQNFVKMMQAVGYGEKHLAEVVDNPNYKTYPTTDVYWNYFSYLAYEDKTAARNDFLAHALALK